MYFWVGVSCSEELHRVCNPDMSMQCLPSQELAKTMPAAAIQYYTQRTQSGLELEGHLPHPLQGH